MPLALPSPHSELAAAVWSLGLPAASSPPRPLARCRRHGVVRGGVGAR